MSGLYSMIMPRNPILLELCQMAGMQGMEPEHIGRLRDAWIAEDGKQIYVLHRNYGDQGEVALAAARALDTYASNTQCGADHTYGYYTFDIKDEDFVAVIKSIADAHPKLTENCMDRYMAIIEDIGDGNMTDEVRAAGDVIRDAVMGSMINNETNTASTPGGSVSVIPLHDA